MQNDLISRSALIAYVKEVPTYDPTDRGFIFKRYPKGLFAPDDIVKSIQNAPAVDAVEVVRCKDCKHKRHLQGATDEANVCGLGWGLSGIVAEEDFCSYGKRRADDGK